MTTMMDYALMMVAVGELNSRFDPRATPVPPSRWNRLSVRVRTIF
jgi:hypothetical protein